ncbi:hypothetical protein ABIC37_000015 [Priestia megaterium]|nr:hypothetical protein EV581_10848 [Bacillus sp. BK006]
MKKFLYFNYLVMKSHYLVSNFQKKKDPFNET